MVTTNEESELMTGKEPYAQEASATMQRLESDQKEERKA